MTFIHLERNIFVPILCLSAALHLFLLCIGKWNKSAAQVSVIQAPSSVEVSLVKEFSKPSHKISSIQSNYKEKVIVSESRAALPEIMDVAVNKRVGVVKQETVKEFLEFKEHDSFKQESITNEPNEFLGAYVQAQSIERHSPSPVYPARARERGWQGGVLLKVAIEENGYPSEVELQRSSGYELLDSSAINTVKNQWRFVPAQLNGQNVRSEKEVEIIFKLTN